jgi:3-polyprenyl-4-hydroxybenzoate decarboxylase
MQSSPTWAIALLAPVSAWTRRSRTTFPERAKSGIACESSSAAHGRTWCRGDVVDLSKLPIRCAFKVDAALYITAGQIVARDSAGSTRPAFTA